ncbi:MAG: hypothetical protein JNG85_14710 [Spirochaetaceae bacterium]|nr:hypothetical protein [Spirochaetaceae bacterium]
MKERPILFSGPMVLAILEGRKTQTRRAIKQFPTEGYRWGGWIVEGAKRSDAGKATVVPESNWKYCATGSIKARCPYGQPGDRLWVRETHIAHEVGHVQYAADYQDHSKDKEYGVQWTPSIHMLRWACRLVLEVVSVRAERLNDISEEDAKAEGSYLGRCPCLPRERDKSAIEKLFQQTRCHIHGDEFRELWDSINLARGYGWDVNPWVWVVEFKRIEGATHG